MDDTELPTILDDLQLAAELGRTLLERNRELEGTLKHANVVLEDQSQEIEYLRKQNAALREVNDSRLRIYEQLEVSIQDLEREKHRLAVENAADKKKIKNLMQNSENLEAKNLELNKHADDVSVQLEIERRKNRRLAEECEQRSQRQSAVNHSFNLSLRSDEAHSDDASMQTPTNANANTLEDFAAQLQKQQNAVNDNGPHVVLDEAAANHYCEAEMQELRVKYEVACQRINELEEQIQCLNEERKELRSKISSLETQEQLSSVHQELLWQGLCNPYGGSLENYEPEEDYSIDETESVTDPVMPATDLTEKDDNNTSDAINNENVFRSTADIKSTTTSQQSSELSANPYKHLLMLMETQQRSKNEDTGAIPKEFRSSQSPCSSYNDESDASSKHTQTDENSVQLFSTMANFYKTETGTDVIESRFKNRPEYKELFKEIFDTLKTMSTEDQQKVPELQAPVEEHFSAVYNMFEELSVDDTQSIDSSIMSEQSIMSERITKIERKNIKKAKKAAEKEKTQKPLVMGLADGRIVTPYNRDPLLDVINITGKKRARHSRKKKEKTSSRYGSTDGSMGLNSPTPSLADNYKSGDIGVEFRPSTATQNLNKLKKLDLSYAEVLRRAAAAAKPAAQGKFSSRRN